jgi:head-tail adaptor
MAKSPRRHGALNQTLLLQRRGDTDDGWGATIPGGGEFETVAKVAASLIPRTGGEEVTAARLGGRQPYVVCVLNMPVTRQITISWQLVDARNPARVLAVASPPADPDGKGQWLEFIAVDGAPS